tara:strand:- start:157 stop:411 length:255 start_codon:yes stop_codon:yes gene_type:complete
MEDYQKEDRILISSVASAIAKSIFYIGICITVSLLFSTCKVDSETIAQCEDACGNARGIKEVTAWSCTCNEIQGSLNSPWVLPQ